MKVVINRIEKWIKDVNYNYKSSRYSCSEFIPIFEGYFSTKFLENAYFVIVDEVPKPDFPELREMGLGTFIDMPVNGITFIDTYYLRSSIANHLQTHFHELVHVVQWQILGALPFIQRYIQEIQEYGYELSPLEEMAYYLDSQYASEADKFDVYSYVQNKM